MHALRVQISGDRLVVARDDRELDHTYCLCLLLVLKALVLLDNKVILVARAEVELLARITLVYVRKERAVPDRSADGVVEGAC